MVFFDQVKHHKISKAAHCASSIALKGLKRTVEFSVVSIDIMGGVKAFLLESLLEEEISLIAGLDEATMFVAIIDEHGIVIEASPHFRLLMKRSKFYYRRLKVTYQSKPFYP